MTIDQNRMTLTDQPDFTNGQKLTGTGVFSNQYLHLSMQYRYGKTTKDFVQIEDVNDLIKDQLVARKQVYASDGTARHATRTLGG